MSLPVPAPPYPLGPWSLVTAYGNYFFPGGFRAGALVPGTAARDLRKADSDTAWRLDSDGKRVPAVLTLTGDLMGHASESGLREAAATLKAAVEGATELVRDNGDGSSREIAVDRGRVRIEMLSRQRYRATVTLYPTGATVATGTPPAVPAPHNWVTDDGDPMVTDDGDRLVFVTT